jgi:hypothetical protein
VIAIADTPGQAFAAQGSPLWFVAWHTPIAASSRLSGMGVYPSSASSTSVASVAPLSRPCDLIQG